MTFYNNNENCIEWINGQKELTVSFCALKWVNRIRKLSNEHPDDVKIIAENADGSICAKIPLSFLKLSAPRFISDEQKEAARTRLKDMWAEKESSDTKN